MAYAKCSSCGQDLPTVHTAGTSHEYSERLIVSANEYLATNTEGKAVDRNMLRDIAHTFGDQLLGVARGINFPGYDHGRTAKFMLFGNGAYSIMNELRGIIGKRKFWLRRWHAKGGLYGRENIGTFKHIWGDGTVIPEDAIACGNEVFTPGEFTVFRIFFQEES